MIRVNLLEGTAEQRATMQKTKVAARRGQQLFMLGAALAIFGIAMAVDYLWVNNAHSEAESQLKKEQEEAKRLEADIARKNELENELKRIEERIKIIRQLRAEQKGPVAMLSAINERLPSNDPEFQLSSIVQKGNTLQIVGSALNQQTISDFAHRLEFSNGMFTNLSFSLEGKEEKVPAQDQDGEKRAEEESRRVYHFTITCVYNKPHDPSSEEKPAAQQNK